MNGNSCKSSILVCIMFYVVTKLLLYIFMQERIHTIRAAEYTRLKDKPYIIGMVIIMTGSIAIVIYAMYTAQAHVSASSSNSGTCRIGLTPVAAGLLLGWDLTMNIWLTLLFVSLLLPTLRARAQLGNTTSMSAFTRHLVLPSIKAPTPLVSMLSRSPSPTSPPADPEPEVELQIVQSASPIVESLERLIRKSLLGVLLIVIPTTVNLVQFIRMDMLESGFQCFLTCLLDSKWPFSILICGIIANHAILVTATTMVFHWLTMTPRETHSGTPMAT